MRPHPILTLAAGAVITLVGLAVGLIGGLWAFNAGAGRHPIQRLSSRSQQAHLDDAASQLGHLAAELRRQERGAR
jgi:hypothetical protein